MRVELGAIRKRRNDETTTPAAEWRSGDESKAVEDKIKGLVSRAPKSLF
jgi:hypothetical protein